MEVRSLTGRVRPGSKGWVRDNWPKILNAHAAEFPEIGHYVHGSFNVDLVDPPTLTIPGEADLMARAREHGRRLAHRLSGQEAIDAGCDLLLCGNYIHPRIRVARVNGHAVGGLLYFGGLGADAWPADAALPPPRAHAGIEIIAAVSLRDLLGLAPDAAGQAVTVELHIAPP